MHWHWVWLADAAQDFRAAPVSVFVRPLMRDVGSGLDQTAIPEPLEVLSKLEILFVDAIGFSGKTSST